MSETTKENAGGGGGGGMKALRFLIFILIGIPLLLWCIPIVIGADLFCNIIRFNRPTDWDLTIAFKDLVLELFKGEGDAGRN